jgi:hypothetical protein
MKRAIDREMESLFAESVRLSTPGKDDRRRISAALRARLGADVVDGGGPGTDGASGGSLSTGLVAPLAAGSSGRGLGAALAPEAARGVGGALSRSGWIKIVIAASIASGALGFLLGASLHRPEPAFASSPPSTTGAAASTRLDAPLALEQERRVTEANPRPGAHGLLTTELRAARALAAAPGAGDTVAGVDPEALQGPADPPPVRRTPVRSAARTTPPQRADLGAEAAPAGGTPSGGTPSRAAPAAPASAWSFSEILERLRRANLALARGQTSLALVHLAELDRHAGEALREERDVTRVLALCALGEQQAAERAASELLSRNASSIYSGRIEQSCAASARP